MHAVWVLSCLYQRISAGQLEEIFDRVVRDKILVRGEVANKDFAVSAQWLLHPSQYVFSFAGSRCQEAFTLCMDRRA